MKKIILLLLILLAISSSVAQEKAKKPIGEKKNELRIDMVKLLAVPSLEIEYERILSTWSSTGGFIMYGDGDGDLERKFRIGGFYRGYFTQNKEYGTKGFYAEILTGYYEGDEYLLTYFDFNDDPYNEVDFSYNGLEAGFKLGYKWVNKTGFIIQADLGISRGLFRSEYSPENFLLGGVKIGWRF